ncbi:hypothetical protein GOODEAATRI_002156, partial [Goodea atripinnis]
TDRVAYLPDSPEGNRVLGLLRRAFEQRLIFTIGTSMTTGLQNVITWNDIHHKTSIFGGPRCLKPACPICNTFHGVYTGTQPQGTMTVNSSLMKLPGFEKCGTLVIQYTFPAGIQGVRLAAFSHCSCSYVAAGLELIFIHQGAMFPSLITGHPNPGVRYSSTSRTAYLPDCAEGQKVLRLLKKAFDRRLTFTIGRSATTGLNNVITWNDIHHKTNIDGGPQW